MSIDSIKEKYKINRPSKQDLFLFLAYVVKEFSCDSQTKVGTVITTFDNRIISTGYNGPPPGLDNEKIPNIRPDKYPWYDHAEHNAVLNCRKGLPSEYGGGIAYVTHISCWNCSKILYRSGVQKIVQLDNPVFSFNHEEENLKKDLCSKSALEIITVRPDFSFSLDLFKSSNDLGLIHTELEKLNNCFKGDI